MIASSDNVSCWACGSSGDHPTWKRYYWPCGTRKFANFRGEQCYENEIFALRHLLSWWLTVAEVEGITGELVDQTKKALREKHACCEAEIAVLEEIIKQMSLILHIGSRYFPKESEEFIKTQIILNDPRVLEINEC